MRYDYHCTLCKETWEEVQFMNDRDLPLSEPCPHCKQKECVKRGVVALAVSHQGAKTVLQRAGSGWNDTLNKIKKASGRENSLETR